MAVRAINRRSGTAGLRSATANAMDLVADSAASDLIKYKDSGGTVRSVVTADNVQTLTNKTISAPTPVAPDAYLIDGAITIKTHVAKLTKATAGAYTLAAPTAAQEGTRLSILNQTSAAHVITATGLIDDGVTGGSKTTATFAAFPGSGIELIAINLKWGVLAKNLVTIT
jgi:hypothetical protein